MDTCMELIDFKGIVEKINPLIAKSKHYPYPSQLIWPTGPSIRDQELF